MSSKSITENVTATPAYGRDYQNRTQAVEAFISGKDWLLQSVTYGFDLPFSIRDVADGVTVTLRFKSQRQVALHKVGSAAVTTPNKPKLFCLFYRAAGGTWIKHPACTPCTRTIAYAKWADEVVLNSNLSVRAI